ncbi:MAG: AfsR/SARP family transcriptional regulator [Gemmatimonadales bacterium]
MIELTLLGPNALRGPDERELGSLLAQPKRFALLAYLALDGVGGYHRRDTLAAMFWPEMDQFAARRALRNTLYHLREALGDGVIVTQGDDAVSINRAMLTCDVVTLGEAVAGARWEEAVDLYRGELLAGVHFAGAGEAFEAWLSHERTRVAGLVMRAVRPLVEREESAGNLRAAAYWAQRACMLAPSDENWLRRAMTLFDQASDIGSALALYDTCARRLATEFNARPGAETQALAARIRSGNAAATTVRSSTTAANAPSAPAPGPSPVASGEEYYRGEGENKHRKVLGAHIEGTHPTVGTRRSCRLQNELRRVPAGGQRYRGVLRGSQVSGRFHADRPDHFADPQSNA